jgi:hypothetical protein
LLAAARSLADVETEWWRGVTFSSMGCVGPQLLGPCEENFTTVGPQTPDAVGDVRSFVPVSTRQGVACTSLSGVDVSQLAGYRLDQTREWALGHVLQTGNHTTHNISDGAGGYTEVDNPALNDAEDVVPGTALPAIDAVACLEQHAADNFFGGSVHLHASPLVASHLLASGVVERDGRRLVTALGSSVIVSPGYTGSELYVTSEVFAAAGERSILSDVDRQVNEVSAWAEDLVMAVFDPCWFGRVEVDVALCAATS